MKNYALALLLAGASSSLVASAHDGQEATQSQTLRGEAETPAVNVDDNRLLWGGGHGHGHGHKHDKCGGCPNPCGFGDKDWSKPEWSAPDWSEPPKHWGPPDWEPKQWGPPDWEPNQWGPPDWSKPEWDGHHRKMSGGPNPWDKPPVWEKPAWDKPPVWDKPGKDDWDWQPEPKVWDEPGKNDWDWQPKPKHHHKPHHGHHGHHGHHKPKHEPKKNYYPHCHDPSKFIQCDGHGQCAGTQKCMGGTVWDDCITACQWPHLASHPPCKGPDPWPKEPSCDDCPGICSKSWDGKLYQKHCKDPTNSWYAQCDAWGKCAGTDMCMGGTVFDMSIQGCNYPEKYPNW